MSECTYWSLKVRTGDRGCLLESEGAYGCVRVPTGV